MFRVHNRSRCCVFSTLNLKECFVSRLHRLVQCVQVSRSHQIQSSPNLHLISTNTNLPQLKQLTGTAQATGAAGPATHTTEQKVSSPLQPQSAGQERQTALNLASPSLSCPW